MTPWIPLGITVLLFGALFFRDIVEIRRATRRLEEETDERGERESPATYLVGDADVEPEDVVRAAGDQGHRAVHAADRSVGSGGADEGGDPGGVHDHRERVGSVSDERAEEEAARLRYLCYLEAYTEARCGGVVNGRKVIERVTHAIALEDFELSGKVGLARAVAYGASDGSHGCPKPLGPLSFERFVRDHDERDAVEATGERVR